MRTQIGFEWIFSDFENVPQAGIERDRRYRKKSHYRTKTREISGEMKGVKFGSKSQRKMNILFTKLN